MVPAWSWLSPQAALAVLGQHIPTVEGVYVSVQEEEKRLEEAPGSPDFSLENRCLTNDCGLCLKHMAAPLGAEDCHRQIIEAAPRLQADGYHLAPYTPPVGAGLLIPPGYAVPRAALRSRLPRLATRTTVCRSRLHITGFHRCLQAKIREGLGQG